ncbi:MAG: hypothetical protein M1817_006468 [Caeruleum heppii]|nr:MAG: hypothetical protein M1817_006468 [Caeruleum heppii]
MSPHPSSTGSDPAILPSHGISLDVPATEEAGRPAMIRHMSSPSYQTPLRHHHHRRNHSSPRQVKETLDARSEYTNSEDDGQAQHRINQYIIKQELGRGSFGAVHLAVDQYGTEYAVKEFSKSRLRKRARSNILRRPPGADTKRRPGQLAAGVGFNSPLHRHSASDIHDQEEGGNPLYLIKEEIAIMKKLDHPNLISLIEVLDDPEEDSLYMVLEMCKKGVIMKVGVDNNADPYDAECCRQWFRDLILGIEYLHAQGVVHRDIKPDNLLLTGDDILKIGDFGVSEMFEKQSEMLTAKSAGSPAFLPPELCISKHGGISGKAADIWSMGITLYCLRFGHIPFRQTSVLELYEAIRKDGIAFEPNVESDFVDLMTQLLEKDPTKRIKMSELRDHPWVTQGGKDLLPSTEENIADLVEPPTEEEMNMAITGNFRQLLTVMKAVKRFKHKALQKRPHLMESLLGQNARMVQPPLRMASASADHIPLFKSKSVDIHDRRPVEQALVAEGVHRPVDVEPIDGVPMQHMDSAAGLKDRAQGDEKAADFSSSGRHEPDPKEPCRSEQGAKNRPDPLEEHLQRHSTTHEAGKGQAHDPNEDEPRILHVGPGPATDEPDEMPVDAVSESPPGVSMNIYEKAYQDEVKRIRAAQGQKATVYLTRRVEKIKDRLEDSGIVEWHGDNDRPKVGWGKILEKTKEKTKETTEKAKATVDEVKSSSASGKPDS